MYFFEPVEFERMIEKAAMLGFSEEEIAALVATYGRCGKIRTRHRRRVRK